jgi:chemotaxis protein MotB
MMSDEDKTRQVRTSPGNEPSEVFEIGDSSVVQQPEPSAAPPPPPHSGGNGMPWLLFVLTLGAAGALGWFYVLPQKDALSQTEARATALDKELKDAKERMAKTDDELKQLSSKASELEQSVQQKDAALKELTATKEELEGKLKSEIASGDVNIKQYKGELVIDLVDKILFASGEAELNDKGKNVLKQVGETMLKVKDKVLQIGGHTDNQAISPKLKTTYPSNWELSTARALNVVHFLQDDVKIPGERLAVAGFSEFRPMAKNSSPDGRKKNRRIEVILLQKK